MFKEFKTFLLRGNAIDLAIGVVVGTAFGAVVATIVQGLLTPLISLVVRTPDLGRLSFSVGSSVFSYGAVVSAIIYFVLVAASVFFLIVKPVNALIKSPPADPTTKKCNECRSEIPVDAKRCAHCTQIVG